MKKLIISTIVTTGFALGVFAQGSILIQNTGATAISTNGSSISQGTGVIPGVAGQYYFALLTAGAYNQSTLPSGGTNAILAGAFQFSAYATNTATAGRVGTGGGAAGDPLASSPTPWPIYQTNAYLVVGWSVNEGTSWSVVSNELATGNWAANGWFGVSAVGDQSAGGFDSNISQQINPASVFGTALGGAGGINPIGGFSLLPVVLVPVPEPTTIALAGLGGLSLLLFRRRK